MKTIYLEGGNISDNYAIMFERMGWAITDYIPDADLVCFTGGEDVSPIFYGEEKHPFTSTNIDRDYSCLHLYNACVRYGIPMVGICRGAQFLCVANGGDLWQNVNGHEEGIHKAYDCEGATLLVTSKHHQMMRPGGAEGVDYNILLEAGEATLLEGFDTLGNDVSQEAGKGEDVEAVHWPMTKCFGFQPHPEFTEAPTECTQWFFDKLNLIL